MTDLAQRLHAFDYANRKRGSHIADGLNRMQDLVDGPIAEILAAKDAEIAAAHERGFAAGAAHGRNDYIRDAANADDEARMDWLERVGFTTRNREGGNRVMNVHSWAKDDGEWGWTAQYISSNYPTARATIDAALSDLAGEGEA